jgi:hypothetical protein
VSGAAHLACVMGERQLYPILRKKLGSGMEPSAFVPDQLVERIGHVSRLARTFLETLHFIALDTARDPSYLENHMLTYVVQDYLQSVISVPLLVREGIHNVCRREIRFVLEMSIKVCRIQQQSYSTSVTEKLTSLKDTIDSTNISMQKQIDLHLLPEQVRSSFIEEVGRITGLSSNYVHWTTSQILERIEMVEAGRNSGRESPEDVDKLNLFVARGLAASLVFLFHAVPEYVAGDWLVGPNGERQASLFEQSRFIAHIDEYFDYKHERQAHLDSLKRARWAAVTY